MRHDTEFIRKAGVARDTARAGNPLGAVALDIGLTVALLAAGLWVGLPTGIAILLAWIGGAVVTVAVLCGHALCEERRPVPNREATIRP